MVTAELVEGHKPIAPPAGVPVWDVDPYDAATLAEPSGYYAELRHIGPFAYIPRSLAAGTMSPRRYSRTTRAFSRMESPRGGRTSFFTRRHGTRTPASPF